MARAYIGIGSNIRPEENIRTAVRLLSERARLIAISTFYRTPAIGPDRKPSGQPPFVNGVAAVETDVEPLELKQTLRAIEQKLGRQRGPDKYAPRTIDLDLLVYDHPAITTKELVLPDPQIAERAFLAIPLRELASDLLIGGKSIRQIAADLAGQPMEPLADYTRQLRLEITSNDHIESH